MMTLWVHLPLVFRRPAKVAQGFARQDQIAVMQPDLCPIERFSKGEGDFGAAQDYMAAAFGNEFGQARLKQRQALSHIPRLHPPNAAFDKGGPARKV